jgi:thioredoxin-related protein
MRLIFLILGIVLLAGCLNSGGGVSEVESRSTGGTLGSMDVVEFSGIAFHTSYEAGLEEARATGKAVFLYFWSDTCPWCLKFEREVLPQEKVKRALEDNFILVAIDVDAKENLALLGKYRVQGTPTMVFLNSKGEVIQGIIGFLDESKFLRVLDEVLKK